MLNYHDQYDAAMKVLNNSELFFRFHDELGFIYYNLKGTGYCWETTLSWWFKIEIKDIYEGANFSGKVARIQNGIEEILEDPEIPTYLLWYLKEFQILSDL